MSLILIKFYGHINLVSENSECYWFIFLKREKYAHRIAKAKAAFNKNSRY